MVNFSPCTRHTRRASWMNVPYTGSTSGSLVGRRSSGLGARSGVPPTRSVGGESDHRVSRVSVPSEPVAVPEIVDSIAGGRPVVAVWVNELGGVTFSVDGGRWTGVRKARAAEVGTSLGLRGGAAAVGEGTCRGAPRVGRR